MQSFESNMLTPTIVKCSSSESKSICKASSWGMPLCFLTFIALTTISYICFVAQALMSMAGLGSHGKRTIVGDSRSA